MIEKRVQLLEMFEHPEFTANFEFKKRIGCPYSIRSKDTGQITLLDLDNSTPYKIQIVVCEKVHHNGKLLIFWAIETPFCYFDIFNYGEINVVKRPLKQPL